jgi:hypothetical protein
MWHNDDPRDYALAIGISSLSIVLLDNSNKSIHLASINTDLYEVTGIHSDIRWPKDYIWCLGPDMSHVENEIVWESADPRKDIYKRADILVWAKNNKGDRCLVKGYVETHHGYYVSMSGNAEIDFIGEDDDNDRYQEKQALTWPEDYLWVRKP